jgi:hypothetical protein
MADLVVEVLPGLILAAEVVVIQVAAAVVYSHAAVLT